MPSTSTTKIYYVDPSATPLSTQNYTVTLNTSLTCPTTRCHFQHPAKPFRLKHPTSLTTTSLAAPRTNRLKAANKELSLLCVVKAKSRNSFVCLKIYSVRENNKFPQTLYYCLLSWSFSDEMWSKKGSFFRTHYVYAIKTILKFSMYHRIYIYIYIYIMNEYILDLYI